MGGSKRKIQNFDIFSGYSWYTPGFGGLVGLLMLLFAGALFGSMVTLIISKAYGSLSLELSNLVAYPLMFIPAMIYAGVRSRSNALFETGYALDSAHFGRLGGLACALIVSVATFAAGFMTDIVSAKMPEMPEFLKEALEAAAGGNIWLSLLCVSVFAPIFEEWLCRGEILRGLLNSKKADGSRLVTPAAAIIISALFFAFIHLNPWQAIPAFIIGCLMGYVYYKTGSLRLTMLMHCVNNTISVIASHIDAFEDKEFWVDVLGDKGYAAGFVICGIILYLAIKAISKIGTQSPQGNCDVIES